MTSRWRTTLHVLRRAGPGALLTVVLRRGLRPLGAWQALVFCERDLALEIPEPRAGVPLETRVVAPRELQRYRPALEAAALRWEKLEARAAQGDMCTIALFEGRLVHVSWVTTAGAWVPELRATIRPGPGEAYVYDAFTLPEMRGREVQPAVSARLLAWARDAGHRHVTFYVRGSDPSALRIVAKTNARRTAVVRCFRLKQGGAWIMGLDPRRGPRIEFDPAARVRRLGPLGLWVRGQAL